MAFKRSAVRSRLSPPKALIILENQCFFPYSLLALKGTDPMNETIQSIKSRFSCRHFSSQPVPDELLQQIVDAAKYAPSGKNAQGWHFTVIRTSEGRQLLRDAAGKTPPPGFPQGKKMAAPGMPEAVMQWPFQGDSGRSCRDHDLRYAGCSVAGSRPSAGGRESNDRCLLARTGHPVVHCVYQRSVPG